MGVNVVFVELVVASQLPAYGFRVNILISQLGVRKNRDDFCAYNALGTFHIHIYIYVYRVSKYNLTLSARSCSKNNNKNLIS